MKVEPNSVWTHKYGNRYKVLFLTNEKSERLEDYPITVVYYNLQNKTLWSRKLDDWHRSMTFHGYDYEYNDPNIYLRTL